MKDALLGQIDESILEVRNNVFLSILQAVSKQFGIHYESTELAAFALTRDDIAQLSNNAQLLTAGVSNKDARIKQFGLETSQDAVLAQLYWKKHSLFMSDLISRLANTGPMSGTSDNAEQFYLNLGYSRHLIGLFTEQIRKPEMKILENDIDEITKSYFLNPYWSDYIKEYKQYGLLRGEGRQINHMDLFEQSWEQKYELKEFVSENGSSWDPKVFLQLKAKLEEQKQIIKDYPYSINVNQIVFHSNKAIDSMHPQVFSKLTTAIQPLLYWNEKCSDVILDVQPSGESYVEVLIKGPSSTQHNKYYFPNQFLTTNEGKGFYLGYIYEFDNDNRVDCYHCAMHKNMKTLLAAHYNAVVNSLDKPTDAFLPILGNFCFLFINVMPYARGSAAIGEWLMRGLAKAHGIELGAFSEGISWDFSAFSTISAEKYAKEYERYFQPITPRLMTTKNELMFKVLCDDINQHASQDPSMSEELLALHALLSTLSNVADVYKAIDHLHEKLNGVAKDNRPQRFFADKASSNSFYERARQLLELVIRDFAPISHPKTEKIEPKSGCC